VGDGIYGDDSNTGNIIGRHALHCKRVAFTHPYTDEKTAIEAPVPDDFEKAVEHFKGG
jgi:23S rRNA pseudouridine1911/1915/1917 synthase